MASLAHLITAEHIDEAHRNGGRVTKVINEQYTIKVGKQIKQAHYDLLCDVYSSGEIPCPKPIEFIKLDDGVNVMVMSTIDGLTLGPGMRKWKMTDAQLMALCEELVRGMEGVHRWMVENRPHDGHSIYSVAQGGPLSFPMFGEFFSSPVPIHSWVDINSDQFPQPNDELTALQRRVLDKLAEGEIVFCHMDLHGLNILVKDGRLAALLDWDHAGWYTRNMDVFWMAYAGAVPRSRFVNSMLDVWDLSESPVPKMAFNEGYELNKGYMEEIARRERSVLHPAKAGHEKVDVINRRLDYAGSVKVKDVMTLA